MPRINYNGQGFDVPEQVNGKNLRDILNLSPDETPVMVKQDGSYEPISDHNEYSINDETQIDRVNRLVNG